jgi:4-oxalocrotonate tautomerase
MPNINVEGPPIGDLDIKRQLVKEITESAHKAYKLPKAVIVVVIKENAAENVGVGGELIIDRKQHESTGPGN